MGRGRKPMPVELKRRLTGKPPGPPLPRPPPNPGVGAPPPELSEEEQAVWRQVASAAGHLTPMDRVNLAALAIHTVRGRRYDAIVECDGPMQRDAQHSINRVHPAAKQSRAEAEFVAALSVKLRLTPQAAPAPLPPPEAPISELEQMLRGFDGQSLIEQGKPRYS